jgi:hypothetical protein
MAYSVCAYSKRGWSIGFVTAVFCLLVSSCDFPQGTENGKGSLTIILPGANVPGRNRAAAEGVHLPEAITGAMSYTLMFSNSSRSFSIGPTQDKIHNVELESGQWDIWVIAEYGTAPAAKEHAEVEIRAGEANSVTFTMSADDFITPDIYIGGNQDIYIGTANSPQPTLSVTTAIFPGFTDSILGWNNDFSYQWYYENDGGTRTDAVGAGSSGFFTSAGETLSCTIPNTTIGTGIFQYYVEIINDYEYTGDGITLIDSGTAKKSILVAKVEVISGTTRLVGTPGDDGGTIFYVGPAFIVNGNPCHYLEVAPLTDDTWGTPEWGLDGIYAGAINNGIGAGYTNTQIILAALNETGEMGRAAQIADEYKGGGNNWFLPSVDELEVLWAYSTGLFGTYELWSSNETNNVYATTVRNTDGHRQWPSKASNTIRHVRPIRAF